MKPIKRKAMTESFLKSLIGAVPYAGNVISEVLFDYGARLKQDRLNYFITLLSESLLENSNIELENLKTEDFYDLFESVLSRVAKTKSEQKMLRYKNILLQGLRSSKMQLEFADVYLDLIHSLSEEEIIVLFNHRHFNKEYKSELEELSALNSRISELIRERQKRTIHFDDNLGAEISKLEKSRRKIQSKHKDLSKYREANFYSCSEDIFFFFKQRLYSKGLLYDRGIGAIGTGPFELMSITEFGLEFVQFIKES